MSLENFDINRPFWNQLEYETRLSTEAELMIALEGMREGLIKLEYELKDLLGCQKEFEHNYAIILDNLWNAKEPWKEEIRLQNRRIERLQSACQYEQRVLDEDRAFLELYCQQYAFAGDMVGACADILTCKDTEYLYRWNYWDKGVEEVPYFG